MKRNSISSSSPPPSSQEPRIVDSATTAKRVANWATNLLVSGVIVIVGLSFGRQVTQWWQTDSVSQPVSDLGRSMMTVMEENLVEFGDAPIGLISSEVVGDVNDALQELRRAAHRSLRETGTVHGAPGPAESQLLDGMQELTPVQEQPNEWAIFQLEGPLPMVVAVRFVDQQVAGPARRVVSWGMATPAKFEREGMRTTWKLFTTAIGPTRAEVALPVPPSGNRTLSLRTPDGLVIAGCRGNGAPRDWMTFYDDHFTKMSWQPTGEWDGATHTWRRRFLQGRRNADIAIHSNSDSSLRAIVVITPSKSEQAR